MAERLAATIAHMKLTLSSPQEGIMEGLITGEGLWDLYYDLYDEDD